MGVRVGGLRVWWMLLLLSVLVLAALLVLVPRLIKGHLQTAEMRHTEHLKALEQGKPLPPVDE